MDGTSQLDMRGIPQPGDLPCFLLLLASIVARQLREEAQEQQQQSPSNVVELPQRRKRSAS